ncbi:MAG: response regulator [Gemmatimonadaceae bacterium]
MGARILIVEDSALVTDAFSALFGAAGYDVAIAATVADAITQASAREVDMMLLDLTLPDGSGLDVLDGLRAVGRLPHATIAMTGRDEKRIRESCFNAGCVEVLLKPLPVGELLRHIERHLA